MALALRKPEPMTVADFDRFLAARPQDDRRWELVDGVPVAQAHALPPHSTVQGALAGELYAALKAAKSPCRVLTEAGIRPAFDPTHNYRVADLAVTCEAYDREARDTRAPVLLVEVLSPDNFQEQRAKLHVYAAMPSVQEILFIDSRDAVAELHRRELAGRADGADRHRPAGAGNRRPHPAAGGAVSGLTSVSSTAGGGVGAFSRPVRRRASRSTYSIWAFRLRRSSSAQRCMASSTSGPMRRG